MAGYELGLITMSDLDVKIQWWVDNSATLTPDELQQIRFLTMPARIRAAIENNVEYFSTSQDIIIPENCNLLKVSFQAAGGNSGMSQTGANGSVLYSGGGGGGGGYIKDYEMSVSPGQVITLTKGDNLTLGALHVERGNNGANYDVTQNKGGTGGAVIWNGAHIDDSSTAVKGGNGQDGSLDVYSSFSDGNTSNGKLAGIGGGKDTPPTQWFGVGGGACGTSNGEDAISPATKEPDNRSVNLGAGASSGSSKFSDNTAYADNAAPRTGGASSPFVIINFVKQAA